MSEIATNISAVFEQDLYFGLQHQDVRRLQQLLNLDPDTRVASSGSGSPSNETEYFGELTRAAVERFQLKHGVIGTKEHPGSGRVGPQTRAKFKEIFAQQSGSLTHKTPAGTLEGPPPQDKCFDVYGDFRIGEWRKENIVRCDLSQLQSDLKHLVLGWQPSIPAFEHKDWFGFECHKLVLPKFKAAFEEIIKRKISNQLETFDGCLAVPPRQMRGGPSWSMHSWGVAVDLNAKWNVMGNEKFEMSGGLGQCFEKVGFTWGGRWRGRFADAMHFQYATVD